MTQRSNRQRVLQLLEAAFAGRAPLGAAIAVKGAEFEIAIPFGADWRRVDSVFFRDCEQLCYLSPLGFTLYLPGFLRCVIEDLNDEMWRDKAADVCDRLTRYDASSPLASHQEKQFRALNARQEAAVAASLLLLERDGIEEARAALDSYWRQRADG